MYIVQLGKLPAQDIQIMISTAGKSIDSANVTASVGRMLHGEKRLRTFLEQ